MDKKKEYDTIKHILHNNKYDTVLLDKGIPAINTKPHLQQETSLTQTKGKWATFTYVGRQQSL